MTAAKREKTARSRAKALGLWWANATAVEGGKRRARACVHAHTRTRGVCVLACACVWVSVRASWSPRH